LLQFFRYNRASYSDFDLDDPDFTFKCLHSELQRVHESLLTASARKYHLALAENLEMKQKLNEVLSAQWRMVEDGWQGELRNPIQGTLSLKMEQDLKGGAKSQSKVFSVTREEQDDAAANLGVFKLRQVWMEGFNEDESGGQGAKLRISEMAVTQIRAARVSGFLVEVRPSDSIASKLIMHPFTRRRLLWDIVGIMFLAWDMFCVPMAVYEPEENTFLVVMDFVTLMFWLADIVVSCLTGFTKGRHIVLDPAKVVAHYFRSRFLVDILVVGPDAVFTALKYTAGIEFGDNMSRLIRAFRIIRIYRVTRIQKLRKLWTRLKDQVDSELVFVLPGILQHIALQVILGHFLASAFYLVGRASLPRTWVGNYGYEEKGFWDRYFTSLHWALSRFALGSTEIFPQNALERVFAITVNIIGMVFFMWFASSITDAFLKLRSLDQGASQEMWLVRRYLRQRKVPSALSVRILHYAETVCMHQMALVPESKVKMLALLSDQLVSELKCAVHFPDLGSHPIFKEAMNCIQILEGLTNSVLTQRSFAGGELVAAYKTRAVQMVLVCTGGLAYYHSCGTQVSEHLWKGDWICEMALWTNWLRLGETVAEIDAEGILISGQKFGEVVLNSPVLHAVFANYAEKYVFDLNACELSDLQDITIASGSHGIMETKSRIDQSKNVVYNKDCVDRKDSVSSVCSIAKLFS
jgi:hypothetical protein